MARIRKSTIQQQDVPDSGERVMMPKAGSKFNKPVKPNTPEQDAAVKSATAGRKAWEATPVGQARTTGIPDVNQGQTRAMRYHTDNYDVPEDKGPRIYDRQLPGMADPNQAPRPPKWEELSDNARAHTTAALAARGTNIGQMTKDFGAQLDQAHLRADRNGTTEPYASRFYESGEPRQRIDASARMLGVPPVVHAMSNAFTSPNTKFSINRADGTTSYPNDEAAIHATRWVQQGHDPEAITNELSTTGTGVKRAQGYVTNIRKAAKGVEQHMAGVAPADWKLGSTDKSPFDTAPKTGPYANSWSDSHPQFTVADVHTGGGGAFPHLSADKDVQYTASGEAKTNAKGKEVRGKSERERALESVPFAHSAVDYANRQAMTQRGLGSVRRSQASQWGEEQIQRGEAGLRGAPKEHQAYPPPASTHMGSQFPGGGEQLDLFSKPKLKPVHAPGRPDERSDFAKKMGSEF